MTGRSGEGKQSLPELSASPCSDTVEYVAASGYPASAHEVRQYRDSLLDRTEAKGVPMDTLRKTALVAGGLT